MYHLFWADGPVPGRWRHESFDSEQGLEARRRALQASAGAAAFPLMRAFYFPDDADARFEPASMLAWLAQFARHELALPACSPAGTGMAALSADADAGNRMLVRVGARAYCLNPSDTSWLSAAIHEVTRQPASEEFLQLEPPEAVIIATINNTATEFELYDGWTTLADLVSGHWPFPAGLALRDKIASGAVAVLSDAADPASR